MTSSNNFSPPKRFVGIHAHSGASTFDGLGVASSHIDFILENGMDAWALTDHGHMNGFAYAYLHAEKLKKANKSFKFIPGCEMYVHPDLEQWKRDKQIAADAKLSEKEAKKLAKKQKEAVVTDINRVADGDDETVSIETSNSLTIENEEETKSGKAFNPVNRRHHLVVLPKTSGALLKLFRLVSRGYLEGFYRFPRVDLKMIKEAAGEEQDLIISSACLGGPLSYAVFSTLRRYSFDQLNASVMDDPSVMKDVIKSVANTYDGYADAVGPENVMLELQFNKLPAQDAVNRALIAFARANGLEKQLVVTADSHYPRPELWKHREMYKKLGYLNYSDLGPESIPQSIDQLKCQLYPKNASQIWDEYLSAKERNPFYEAEGADQLVSEATERTHDLAHNVIGNITFDRSYKYPTSIIPKDTTAFKLLCKLAKEGIVKRNLHTKQEYLDRLQHELGVIQKLGNAAYFITLAKALQLARDVCLVGVARGSSGGSLVAYVLYITDLDPIKYECRFDRFLNAHRCLLPQTQVMLENGTPKQLGDLNVGDKVMTHDNTPRIVSYIQRSFHQRLYQIKVGDTTFVCSANHEWLVKGHDGTPYKKRTDQLTTDDCLYKVEHVDRKNMQSL